MEEHVQNKTGGGTLKPKKGQIWSDVEKDRLINFSQSVLIIHLWYSYPLVQFFSTFGVYTIFFFFN